MPLHAHMCMRALPRHGHACTHTPACKHVMCTHTWHTPPPSYTTPPAAQFVGVGDHLSQSREETHLEVSVDDPHLVTMENSLQDLLDTVTVQTAGRLVEWSWGGRGGGGGAATGDMGKAGVLGFNPQPGGARRMGESWRKERLATRESFLSPKVSSSSPCSASHAGPRSA